IVTAGEELHALPPIHTVLKSAEGKTGQVPVHLRAILTEIGTLELWCVSDATNEQWRLEFELRATTPAPRSAVIESMPPQFAEARRCIQQIFGGKPIPGSELPAASPVKKLWRSLEQALGMREQWRVPLLREMWSALHSGAARRRRSADHERIW